jgi:hypothetical protein
MMDICHKRSLADGAPGRGARRLVPLLALCLLPLTGCVYSIQPWYAADAGGADPALLGIWQEVDSQNTWVFLAAGDSLRLLDKQADGPVNEFTAVTFQYGDWTFMDLSPAGQSLGSGNAAWYLLPLHGLHWWTTDGDTLRVRSLNPDAVTGLMESSPHPPMDERDNKWIFTGTRDEMTQWLETSLLEADYYGEPTVLVRR